MKRYDSAALKKWNRDVERDSVPLSENFRNLMDDSVMFASVSKIEGEFQYRYVVLLSCS